MIPTGENEKAPLSTQGDANEKEEQLGGTTNLSVDQLKKEGDVNDPQEDIRSDNAENNNINTENRDLTGAP